ncbi:MULTISPECIES: DUF883 C-terminal domain-containing protein [Thalassotalea]|uniref:DUF883 C-terminal domain-containing protein n=1 Tax=Thalassotalea TaxID=1518149 RepID=UPI000941DEE4|nr:MULTISPECIES: DUF883 C-terminal domain-containing protein [Thalassotalea]OKY25004.1 DUF883 domain-containing protein [Thalassotalea sp. PP2-459]
MASQATKAQSENSESKTTKGNGSSPIANKLTESLHQSVDHLGEQAAKTEESLRKNATNSANSMKDKQVKVQSMWNQSAVGRYTQEHPVASAGIAFAAGMLLTSLLKRK